MAAYEGSMGGRSGPYWRRQMGTTLPGEYTGAQLNILNLARQRLGLPPLGGPRRAFPRGGNPVPAPGHMYREHEAFPQEHPGRYVDTFEYTGGPAFGGGPIDRDQGDVLADMGDRAREILGQGHLIPLPVPKFGKPAFGGNGHADLRARLLAQFQGAQAPTSRDALRQYVQQHQLRRAIPGQGRQPILPRRQPRRAIPY